MALVRGQIELRQTDEPVPIFMLWAGSAAQGGISRLTTLSLIERPQGRVDS
ncbi:MAG: hypothetical protein KA371_11150 [Acidobacteria bacterium]|nr:hypothetical protein [Acidobacteriota bacterium]